MGVVLSTVRRVLLVPGLLPVATLGAGSAWAATWLARAALGGDEGFVGEVRQGSLLFAGLLVLSLAEPLAVGREVRAGPVLLRVARGGGTAVGRRWLGLLLGILPAVLLAGLASGGWPTSPLALLAELAVLCAAGLALGSWFERGRLVPALWLLATVSCLRPWIVASGPAGPWLGWFLPGLGTLEGPAGLLHAALWTGGALLAARWRLLRLVAR